MEVLGERQGRDEQAKKNTEQHRRHMKQSGEYEQHIPAVRPSVKFVCEAVFDQNDPTDKGGINENGGLRDGHHQEWLSTF